jgi:hypothetical protein
MTTSTLATDARETLDGQWDDATVAVIHAQIAYAELVSQGVAEDETVAAAWLRLWRAQERQRQLSWELDRMEI